VCVCVCGWQDILGFGANFFSKKVKQLSAASELKTSAKEQAKLQPLIICGPSGAGSGLE
jgi:hypothetical protein